MGLSGYYERFFKSCGFSKDDIGKLIASCGGDLRQLKELIKHGNGKYSYDQELPHKLSASQLHQGDPRKRVWEKIDQLFSQNAVSDIWICEHPSFKKEKSKYQAICHERGKKKEEPSPAFRKCRWCDKRHICIGTCKDAEAYGDQDHRGLGELEYIYARVEGGKSEAHKDEMMNASEIPVDLKGNRVAYIPGELRNRNASGVWLDQIPRNIIERTSEYDMEQSLKKLTKTKKKKPTTSSIQNMKRRLGKLPDEMMKIVEEAHGKQNWLELTRGYRYWYPDPLTKKDLIGVFNRLLLTEREAKCLFLFTAKAMTKKEIAKKLRVSENTVKTFISRARKKLGNLSPVFPKSEGVRKKSGSISTSSPTMFG